MNELTEAPLRRVRLLRGYGALVIAAVLGLCLVIAPYERSARIVGSIVVALVIVGALVQLRLAKTTPETVLVGTYIDPNQLPLSERIRYFRRQLVITAVVFPTASAWVIYTLGRLESGAARRATLWWPIAFVYQNLGYWPAVVLLPVTGLGLCGMWLWKMNSLDRPPLRP